MPFGVGLFGVGAMGGVALFGLNPGFLMLGQIGIMGKVGMGGGGSSKMELIGVTLLVAHYFAMIKLSQAWLIHVHAFVAFIFLSKGGY